MTDDIAALVSRLEAVADELADLAIDRLRASIAAGGREAPLDERRITRARRAIDKAIALLRASDDGAGENDGE